MPDGPQQESHRVAPEAQLTKELRMQTRLMGAIALGPLAASLLVATPALAQMRMSSGSTQYSSASRPGDIWTGGGLLFAPRYLAAGGGQVGIGPAFVFGATPGVPASPVAGELGIDYAIMDGTEVYALLAPVTMAGFRGQIMANDYGAVGWDVNYRADFYPDQGNMNAGKGSTATSGPTAFYPGLTAAPIFGGLAMSQGAEARIDAEQKFGPLNGFASLGLKAMSIGLKPGLGLGLDLDLGRIVLGYNIVGEGNVTPVSSRYNGGLQLEHGLGGRIVLSDNTYLQANWFYRPQDDLYNAEQGIVVGVGYQWGSAAAATGGSGGMIMSQ